MVRGYIALAGVAASVAVTAVAASAADDNVPKFTNVSAKPARFCAKSSDKCARTGTTIRFTISTAATVTGDIRPRKSNIYGYREFRRKFPAGANSVRLNDNRLTTGRWTFRLLGVNSVGLGGPALVDLRVIR